jgi:glycosyltransferase involved in cell wall biosynthesis
MQPKVSLCLATYNMSHIIMDTLVNILEQDYDNKEIVVYDDCSTDGTQAMLQPLEWIKYIRGDVNKGVGAGFNAAIAAATGEIVILMCADDLWTDRRAISDIVGVFNKYPNIGYVTRWYHQFVGNDRRPVRAWRGNDPIILANNPSGLAFRKIALEGCSASNRMFVETSALASQVLCKGWSCYILAWDVIAVRVHASTSTQGDYWLKRRVSSPIVDWVSVGGHKMLLDYSSFIQIKTGYKMSAVLEEIWNFVRLRPLSLLNPSFWFYALVATIIPRQILRKLPPMYRKLIGSKFTGKVVRS